MRIGALILAAGSSTRLGSPKQIATIAGETLLDRAIQTAHEAACDPVAVVLGASEDTIRKTCRLNEVEIVSNPRWSEGMGTSLAAGVRTLEELEGVIVMTCDMPGVTANHLRSLVAAGTLSCSSYRGSAGVPAFFPADLFPKLSGLQGDVGARHLLQGARRIELSQGSMDVDNPEDLEQAREMFS